MRDTGELIDDRYLLLRPLSVQADGELWEADNRLLERAVSLKLLASDLSGDAAARARFVAEARAAARIVHPNVATVYDLGVTEEGTPYMVLEPLHGETLADLLDRRGAMVLDAACAVAVQVLAGLEAAHQAGIVHRRLDPACVVVLRPRPDELVAKVLDFGLGELPLGSRDAPVATYLAPEVEAGTSVDGRADVFSVGVMLYEMLAGRPPFPGRDREQIVRAALAGDYPPLRALVPGLPAALERIVDQALAGSPRVRTASARELLVALSPFAAVDVAPSGPAPALDVAVPRLASWRTDAIDRLGRAVHAEDFAEARAGGRPQLQLVSVSAMGEGRMRPEDLVRPQIPRAPLAPLHFASVAPMRSRRPVRIDSVDLGTPMPTTAPLAAPTAPRPRRREGALRALAERHPGVALALAAGWGLAAVVIVWAIFLR